MKLDQKCQSKNFDDPKSKTMKKLSGFPSLQTKDSWKKHLMIFFQFLPYKQNNMVWRFSLRLTNPLFMDSANVINIAIDWSWNLIWNIQGEFLEPNTMEKYSDFLSVSPLCNQNKMLEWRISLHHRNPLPLILQLL